MHLRIMHARSAGVGAMLQTSGGRTNTSRWKWITAVLIILLCFACGAAANRVQAATGVAGDGDVDGNGRLDAADAEVILQKTVSAAVLGQSEEAAADVNHDGVVDVRDAILVLQQAGSGSGYPWDLVDLEAAVVEGGVSVQLTFPGEASRIDDGIDVLLRNLAGQVQSEQKVALVKVDTAKSGTAELSLPGLSDMAELASYVLEVQGTDGGQPVRKRWGLLELTRRLRVHVFGPEKWYAGAPNRARVAVQEARSGQAVAGAEVVVTLIGPDGGESVARQTVLTDSEGVVESVLSVPAGVSGDGELEVSVSAPLGSRLISQSVEIVTGSSTLLTTDKPLYQPGQTIHIRSLTLVKPQMIPAAGQEIVLIVADAKGNKVFKQTETLNEFGVASADFTLASELNLGVYTVSAEVSGSTTEKQVTVDRYALPKFKVELATDRDYYAPGATLSGTVAADYFFGKSVGGGAVTITASKFDVAFEPFAEVSGALDAEGRFQFTLDLPGHFVGQPLQQGEAFALLEVKVTDLAAHEETISRTVPVSANDLVIHAVPESGALIPGVENQVYVLTLYPNNSPARTTCTARIDGEVVGVVETDAAGVGVISLNPVGHSSVVLDLHAADSSGNTADRSLDLSLAAGSESVLLRTDGSLYAVGDEVKLDVFCGGLGGSIFVDVIKDGQTIGSRSLEPLNGYAALVLPLTADMSGSLCLSAYRITLAGNTIRDRRIIYVDPANDLQLTYAPDREVYRPGEDASIRVQVADQGGQGVVAAIGLNIVDEAVFALQEMQPGMEKIYFYLEEQLRQPRYEIHGFNPEDVLHESPVGSDDAVRERVLGMMFATLPDADLGTFEAVSDAADPAAVSAALRDAIWDDLDHLIDPMLDVFTGYEEDRSTAFFEPLIEQAGADKTLDPDGALDPWGMPYRVSYAVKSSEYTFHTAGPDQRWDTADDLQLVAAAWALNQPWMRNNPDWLVRGGIGGFEIFAMNNWEWDWAEDGGFGPPTAGPGGEGGAEPYLRQYFPETLYSNPLLITGLDGSATVNVTMADSITSWRMTGLASSTDGRLGSATGALRVFQEFFVDLDLPAMLTRGDEVSVPVAVYNYLPESQDIRLVLEGDEGFELLDAAEQTLTLAAEEVSVVHFRVRTLRVGHHRLQVTAYGSSKSDAIAREVEVMPDGAELLVTQSGRLSGLVEHLITIPEAAIDGASKILVKIYPGFFSQVVEGLDAMLQMPFGCFEQTSSVTYPNVLVVDYMKKTGVITPEILMKAEGFISTGYQRLLSYEVDGGGFSWFGEAPAHNVLTTYGLLEFSDMSKVWYVDPAVIRRTQDWLVSGQEADGSWIPTEGGIAEGAIDRYQNDVLRTTAYVLWGLGKSGYSGPALDSGAAYLRNQLAQPDFEAETYSLALCAHALLENPDDPLLPGLFEAFENRKLSEGDKVWWEETAPTITYSRGEGASVELTALLAQAYMRYGAYPDTTAKALNYLVGAKDGNGNFGSTQATVLALQAFSLAAGGATSHANATVEIGLNGVPVKTIELTDDNSDLVFLCDLGEQTIEGDNTVQLSLEGTGSTLYQVVGRYYLPWETLPPPAEELISIQVDYDKSELTTDDLLHCTVRLANNRAGVARMLVADVGVPPGFDVLRDDLDALVGTAIQKYELAGRQVILYLDELGHEAPVTLEYRLKARFPVRAQTPESAVYEYYNPEVRAVAEPREIVVTE